jgi:leucine dehydrogenase
VPDCGLLGYIVLDSTVLGPAAGGVRTRVYSSKDAALEDARALARAMTIKCALGGLAAGGAKAVIMDHPGLRRAEAFARLGDIIESLHGRFRTAGDLGTTRADLEQMGKHTQFVHIAEADLSRSVAIGSYYCIKACADILAMETDAPWRISVQGCGLIGRALAKLLAENDHHVSVADLDPHKAAALALNTIPSDEILFRESDILSPCAVGGVLSAATIPKLRVRAICGAANNIVSDEQSHQMLHDTGILFVPDAIASAGGVIDGIGKTVMGLSDRSPLIQALQELTKSVLLEAQEENRPAQRIAFTRAMKIIES